MVAVLVIALPMTAQTEDENIEDKEDSLSADSAMFDSLAHDSIFSSWPKLVQHHIDMLLKSDMFKTSQVGLMIYDLDADSTIYRFNERQLMRPASTMKVITAIAAIDKLGGSYQFKTEMYLYWRGERQNTYWRCVLRWRFRPSF